MNMRGTSRPQMVECAYLSEIGPLESIQASNGPDLSPVGLSPICPRIIPVASPSVGTSNLSRLPQIVS